METSTPDCLQSLRRILERVALLEVEGAVGAVAALLSSQTELQSLILFEFGETELREVAVYREGVMQRPRGRLSLRSHELRALAQWAALHPGATFVALADDLAEALGGASGRTHAATLQMGGEICGFVLLVTPGEESVTQAPEALLALALAVAHQQSKRTSNALETVLERSQRPLAGRVRMGLDMGEIIGSERGLAGVLHRVALVQASALPVLLLGETGCGKEVIARRIHASSPRADRPFVRVNCGAIPPQLIDSALFGHERGSFTGANQQHRGWFERADGGTLFLDEVGELPHPAQVRLLRVLQDGVIERVGGLESIHVDCRILAATHRDLPGMVEEGTFREDLWFRLSAFPVEIPPLRERLEDLPALASFFALRAARLGIPPCVPTAEDLELLRSYHWPGNVRELATVIDRAALLGQGRRLEVAAALGSVRSTNAHRTPRLVRTPTPVEHEATRTPGETLTLNVAMRKHIESVLSAVGGRIEGTGGAADLLGINPHTLRSRMRKLGIDWARFRRHG